jgi:putative transcriptional regulator
VKSKKTENESRRLSRLASAALPAAIFIGLLTIWIGGAANGRTEVPPVAEPGRSAARVLQPVQSLDRPESATFLVAARGMQDPNFAQTVVLVIDYDAQGAFGLIINRPTRHTLAEIWPEIAGLEAHSVFWGGPVFPNRLLFLLRSDDAPRDTRQVISGVHLGSDEPTLKRIIAKGEEEFRTYAGYSGWAPEQLDNEIARGDWHLVPAERRFIFDSQPAEVWDELIQRVDIQTAILKVHLPSLTVGW